LVVQHPGDTLNLRNPGLDLMQPAEQEIECEDQSTGLCTICSTQGCEHRPLARGRQVWDSQRKLKQFQRTGFVGYQRNQINAWHNLDVLVDQLKVGAGQPLPCVLISGARAL